LDAAKVFNEHTRYQSLYFTEQITQSLIEQDLVGSLYNSSQDARMLQELEDFLLLKQRQFGLAGLSVFKGHKKITSVWKKRLPQPSKSIESTNILDKALIENQTTQVVSLGRSDAKTGSQKGELVRAAIAIKPSAPSLTNDTAEPLIVVLETFVSPSVVSLENDIMHRFSNYRQLQHEQKPIRGIYLVGLLLVTLSIIFSATWLGFRLARSITIPIQQLAQGTHAVAAGDLDYQVQVHIADDEIGILIDSFNRMTKDLKSGKIKVEDAYRDLEKTNLELDRRRSYIETVLENIAAGVISIDREGYLRTLNKAAIEILLMKPENVIGQHYKNVFEAPEWASIRNLVTRKEKTRREVLEKELRLNISGYSRTLLTVITTLKDSDNQSLGIVIVFEDLTQLIKAQHISAWGEVAQRIAHEIKNPLTPIQLCAQRLKKRYSEKDVQFSKVLSECTDTIIREVNSLEVLVKEFSRFARMPASQPIPQDLNQVIDDTLSLYSERKETIQIQTHLDRSLPQVYLDAEQTRRILINLIDNALEALTSEALQDQGLGKILISTSFDASQLIARIQIADNGPGMSAELREKIFLPYFSTKIKGSGLGLAIVNRIVADHAGIIKAKANHPQGTIFTIELPTVTKETAWG